MKEMEGVVEGRVHDNDWLAKSLHATLEPFMNQVHNVNS